MHQDRGSDRCHVVRPPFAVTTEQAEDPLEERDGTFDARAEALGMPVEELREGTVLRVVETAPGAVKQ